MALTQPKSVTNEEDIGIDSPDGGDGLSCRVSTTTPTGARRRHTQINAEPGNFIRVAVNFKGNGGGKKGGKTARILAYVDPLTGKGVIRLGLYDGNKEYNRQIMYETDIPVWKGNK